MGGAEDEVKQKEKEQKVISFKYEYLPDFCYNCGIIGHTEKLCQSRNGREDRQYGTWLRAIIYKGSSSEERSKASSDHGKFWGSNSAGSRGSKHGSDGPTWRKSLPSNDDEEKIKGGEERGVTSPLKLTHKSAQTEEMACKKLMFQDQEQKTKNRAIIQRTDNLESEHQRNEETVGKEKVESKKDCNVLKSGKSVKQGTFKRRQRVQDKQQPDNKQNQAMETDGKKRNADMMEVDDETGGLKKARVEVVNTTMGKEEKKENTKGETMNAGLQGQPGEEK
jgi:hypothetical protein